MGYIYRTARNYCIDEYRKDTARNRRESDSIRIKSDTDSLHTSIEFYLDDSLPEIDQKIVRMRFLESKSPKEIAEQLNISVKRVKERLYKAEFTCRISE